MGGVGARRGVSAGVVLNRGLGIGRGFPEQVTQELGLGGWTADGQQRQAQAHCAEGNYPSTEDVGQPAGRADQGPDRGPQETFSFCYNQPLFLQADPSTLLVSWLLGRLPPTDQASQAPDRTAPDRAQGNGVAWAGVRDQLGLGRAPSPWNNELFPFLTFQAVNLEVLRSREEGFLGSSLDGAGCFFAKDGARSPSLGLGRVCDALSKKTAGQAVRVQVPDESTAPTPPLADPRDVPR